MQDAPVICAIVLAAGLSRRMGAQKLLLPFGGSTVIAHVVDRVLASVVAHTCVVVGRDGEAVAAALAGRAISIVTNPEDNSEMLDSVRCGLRALPAECGAVLVALGDQPGVSAPLIDEMAAAQRVSGKGIIVPAWEGKRGHPLLFAVCYRDELFEGYDQTGLRGLLCEHPDDVCEHRVATPWALADMDTPEDYRRALAAFGGIPCAPRDGALEP